MKKVYEFVVVYNPPILPDNNSAFKEEASIIAEGRVLAVDDKVALLLAGRKIPEDYVGKIDNVSVAVRPF